VDVENRRQKLLAELKQLDDQAEMSEEENLHP
jgi:hypothetical protein